MNERIAAIVEHLDCAFGGRSQYTARDLARALVGQINNNGLTRDTALVASIAARIYDGDEYEGDTSPAELQNSIERGLAELAARTR